MTKQITKGNRAVLIKEDHGLFRAFLYVNVRNGIRHADITNLRGVFKTMKAAQSWADKKLAA